MYQSLKHLSVKPINLVSTHVSESNKITIDIFSKNKKRLFYPILLIQCEQLGIKRQLFLFFKKELSLEVEWIPKKRTQITQLEIEIASYDFFYFFKKSKRTIFDQEVLVLPSSINHTNFVLNQINNYYPSIPFGQNNFDLEKIKGYQPGDSPKKIDWKQSSKRQQLMVREYQVDSEMYWMFVFYGRESKHFESLLAEFFYLYQTIKNPDISFYLVGKGIDSQNDNKTKDFSVIEASEDPGELPSNLRKKMIVFTPRKSKILDRELDKLSPHQIVHVVEYVTLEGGN